MRRFYNQDYQQPTDFWSGLLSGYMHGSDMRRERDQEQATKQAMLDVLTPYNVDTGGQTVTQYNGNNQMGTGLMSSADKAVLPNTNFNQTPDYSNVGQGLLSGKAMQTQPQMQQPTDYSFNKVDLNPDVTTTTTAPKTWAQQEAAYRQEYMNRLKGLYQNKDIDNKAISQVLPQLNSMFNDQLTQAKTAYHQGILNDPNADIRTKIQAAMNMGMKANDIKLLLQKGYTNQSVQDLQDRKMPTAFDPYTGQLINTITGKPVTQEELKMGINPNTVYTQEQTNARYDRPSGTAIYNKNTVSADTKYKVANAPVRTGNGRNGTTKLGKSESWAQTYENSGLARDNAIIDTLYGKDDLTTAQQIQLNKALSNRDNYWKISSGGEYGQSDTAPAQSSSSDDNAALYDKTFREIKAGNPDASDEDIYRFMTNMINGG